MSDDKDSLLESLQEPLPGEQATEPTADAAVEGDIGAVADALLAAALEGGDSSSLLEGAESAPSPENPVFAPLPDLISGGDSSVSAEPSLGDLPDPGEDPNPAIAVEEMLASAVLGEGAGVLPTAGEAASGPTFQVRIQAEKGPAREPLQKVAAELGITLPDAAWAAEVPLVSQLTEFQAVQLMQRVRSMGFHGSIDVKNPLAAPTEEELALGELAAIAEAPPVRSEGGAAVKLPGEEKGVLLYSGESLPAFPVQQTLGLVSAHRSIPRRLFRQEESDEKLRKEIERIPGRSASNLPKSRFELLLRELCLDLQKAALAQAGNAVLGIKLEAFPESSHTDPSLDELRLVAIGTAAVVEKWNP